MRNIDYYWKHLVNVFFPMECEVCGAGMSAMDETHVCKRCLSTISPVAVPQCIKCGRAIDRAGEECRDCRDRGFHYDTAYSAFRYDDTIRDIIHKFKFHNKEFLSKILTKLLINYVRSRPEILNNISRITYVPLKWRIIRKRHYNQSEILARALGREFGLPVKGLLVKTRRTRPQNELKREERFGNLGGAFRVGGFKLGVGSQELGVKGERILIVDDVMTTGTTFSECALALKEAGAAEVRCLSIARGDFV